MAFGKRGRSSAPSRSLRTTRHKNGDWGELAPEDVQENEWSLEHDARLFSAYRTRTDEKLWVMTEWDCSATTLLLPEEY